MRAGGYPVWALSRVVPYVKISRCRVAYTVLDTDTHTNCRKSGNYVNAMGRYTKENIYESENAEPSYYNVILRVLDTREEEE